MRRAATGLSLVAAALIAGCGSNERPEVINAVKAPLVAFMSRHATALCRSFTPSVAARLVPGTPDCESGAARAFAGMSSIAEHYGPSELPSGLRIDIRSVAGSHAIATTTWPWPDITRTARLSLERSAGRWRIASRPKLITYVSCVEFPGAAPTCDHYAPGVVFGSGPTTIRLPTEKLRVRVGSLHTSRGASGRSVLRWHSYELVQPKP
jgi:hypothetical protein